MKRIDWKDVAKRAGKTFAQAFIATISIDKFAGITDTESAKAIIYSMLIAGLSAGISAVWNMGTKYFVEKKEG